MSRKNQPDANRRRFLKTVGLTGTAMGAAALATEANATVAEIEDSTDTSKSSGYQESDHVRSYYKTLRN